MEEKVNILSVIKENLGILALFGFLFGSLSFLFLVISEKNFKVTTDFLVIQNQTESRDFYSVSKSAEYLGKVLSRAVYSELFIDEVGRTGKVNGEFLPFDKNRKLRTWSNMINVKRDFQLGVIRIEVFGDNQSKVTAISEGISEVLTQKNHLFRGEGEGINVRILSGPVIEKNPDFSKILSVTFGGFLLGIIIGLLWMYYKVGYHSEIILDDKIREIRKDEGKESMTPEEYEESLKYLERQ